jgi:putative PIN family toxin of toxin-antitoxin system
MSEKNNALRVFVDSNILISAVLSKASISSQLIHLLIEEHHIMICSYSLTEVSRVISDKFPDQIAAWDKFLSTLEFELTYTPTDLSAVRTPYIRDEKDKPILLSAMIAQPDVLVTGDQDFHTPEIQEYFAVYTPADFIRYFGQNYDFEN